MASALHQNVIGLSGVIFSLIVVDNNEHLLVNQSQQRSIFGLFSVPAPIYPWVLLLLWQLLIPEASFLCHLSGLLAGLLRSKGHLSILYISRSAVSNLEARAAFQRLVEGGLAVSFVPLPPGGGGNEALPQYSSVGRHGTAAATADSFGASVMGSAQSLLRSIKAGIQSVSSGDTQQHQTPTGSV